MHRTAFILRLAFQLALICIATEAAAIVITPPPPPNTAPTVTCTQVSSTLISTGSSIIFDASFTDPDTNQFTAVIDWDDGTTSPGAITMTASGTYSVTSTHVYSVPGVYTIALDVWDGQLTGECASEYVVVYNPDAGFVTGGGWFDSPAGAYHVDPTITGRANFGFVSKYLRGGTIPVGSTEFQFQAARLNFHSNSYEWLVVAGAKAMYKGSGTINEQGNYSFMLTAIDGQMPGGGGTDRIRIRIWDATSGIIYDNQAGALLDADATQAISGSIVIHK